MNIMISQPMSEKTTEQIRAERQEVVNKLESLGNNVIDSIVTDHTQEDGDESVYCLSKSIALMAKVEAMYFMPGWENARGCRIEHEVAKAYGLKIIYE